MNQELYNYILAEETNFKTVKVPVTGSVEWNMHDHIERCTNVANGWFHKGANDGMRPYDDIVTPVKNVALRSEGFDVKDIVPYVNDINNSYKSFLIKKYHPQWARKNELDTFIDELVESSVVYDLALIKNVNNSRPEVVKLQQIAFADQTNVMSGPICLKHQYTVAELLENKGKWFDDKIDEAIVMAEAEKSVTQANDQKVKTPGKYITVYELVGNLPEYWLEDGGDKYKYTPQRHFVCYYTSKDGSKNGITLFAGKDKPLSDSFKALVINAVYGRACGKSLIETLFEPQVWNNYSAIKIKKMLDSAVNVLITNSEELAGQNLNQLKDNTILKQERDATTTRLDGSLQNMTAFTNYQTRQENNARILGSASDAQLGTNPVSGTPFALQSLVVQQGQGLHEYRQGKIATFVADVLYRDWILQYVVKDMNEGRKFSEELTFDELKEIADTIARNRTERKLAEMILDGKVVTEEMRRTMIASFTDEFVKGGNRGFFEILKGELDQIPIDVFVNIKGKQKYMAQNADKITNIIREVLRNPQAFQQVPGIAKVFNQLLEDSGLSPVDYSPIVSPVQTETQPVEAA